MNFAMDLHMHTRYSDGAYSPRELLRLCRDNGLQTVAITDHDAMGGLPEGMAAAREAGIDIIPGVELTAEFKEELHILGLGIDPGSQSMQTFLQLQLQKREARNVEMVEKLRTMGIDISHEELVRYAGLAVYGRTQTAQLMVEKGYADSVDAVFTQWLEHGRPAYVKRDKATTAACIEAIHRAGGIAVWAHPQLTNLSLDGQAALLTRLLSEGLDGLECCYTYHTAEETAFCLQQTEKYGILATCGSDFHGGNVHIEATLQNWRHFDLPENSRQLTKLIQYPGDNEWQDIRA